MSNSDNSSILKWIDIELLYIGIATTISQQIIYSKIDFIPGQNGIIICFIWSAIPLLLFLTPMTLTKYKSYKSNQHPNSSDYLVANIILLILFIFTSTSILFFSNT